MKRDMDLVRKILLEVESWSWAQRNDVPKIEGHPDEEVSYHVKMMHDVGLIEAVTLSQGQELDWRPTCLTWDGHDFLDAPGSKPAGRSRRRWSETKRERSPACRDAAVGIGAEGRRFYAPYP
jgi:hypothetical protein